MLCPFAVYIVSKRSVTRVDRLSPKVVKLIVAAVIPTNSEKFSFTACSSSVTDAVNTTNGVSQSAVAVPKLLEALVRTFFF